MNKLVLAISVGTVLFFSGCSLKDTTPTVNYKAYDAYYQIESDNMKYKEITPIHACSSGFIWKSCSSLTKKTLKKLQKNAKIVGGNGVVDVKWDYDELSDGAIPTCDTEFGLRLVSCASGMAVKIENK